MEQKTLEALARSIIDAWEIVQPELEKIYSRQVRQLANANGWHVRVKPDFIELRGNGVEHGTSVSHRFGTMKQAWDWLEGPAIPDPSPNVLQRLMDVGKV